ncbi:leucine-rich repeat-containing protein 70 [Patella vulgata]|uniref:leucine-rich repeat-containing protein 70 n=1 Tax=Patella vulgata TaxID=6465 RepID=UPI00217F5A84|nr:leucine-rich repeat-containing protein 70 [Patella vulgata]
MLVCTIYKMKTIILSVLVCVISKTFCCPPDCSCSIQEKSVNCYGRKLTALPVNIPMDTEILDLRSNSISRVTKSSFQNFTQLKKLQLDFNKITKLEAGTFNNLPYLEIIGLGTNSISTIQKGVFWHLPSVKSIDLTNNFIINLSEGFKNITNINRIDLHGNRIQNIKNEDFRDTTSLLDLILSNNKITQIKRNAFRSLIKLAYLSIKGNPLKKADGLFYKNELLLYMDLSDCQLKSVPKGLPDSIQHLQLNQNNITRIKSKDFRNKLYLRIIVLDENEIVSIAPGAFSTQKNLLQLWLNSNKLTKFPSPLSATVTNVLISNNKISKLAPRDFPEYSMMTDLVLNGNRIQSFLPYTFKNLGKLRTLSINTNKITRLGNKMFSGLKNLKLLSISNNRINSIQTNCFFGLSYLNELRLASFLSNEVSIQGNIFKNIPELKILDIGSSEGLVKNILKSVEMLNSMRNLTEINLKDNNLKTLTSDIINQLSNVQTIKLHDNRWHCDGRLRWMKSWLKQNVKKIYMMDGITCYTPRNLRNKKILDLKPNQFAAVTTPVSPPTFMSTTDVFHISNLVNVVTERVTQASLNRKATTTIKTTGSNTHRKTTRQPTKRKTHKNDMETSIPYTPASLIPTTSIIIREIITEERSIKNKSQTTMDVLNEVSTSTISIYDSDSLSTLSLNTIDKINSSQTSLMADGYRINNKTQSTDISTNNKKKDWDGQSKHLEEAKNFNLIIIIIATSLTLLFILVVIIIVVIICRKREKVVYHRAVQYDKDNGDVFFVGDNPSCAATLNKQSRNNSRSRSERGSTSSRPSEDITSELESTMKIYSLDEE